LKTKPEFEKFNGSAGTAGTSALSERTDGHAPQKQQSETKMTTPLLFKRIARQMIFALLILSMLLCPAPALAVETFSLENVINRALRANRSMIDARDDIRRAEMRLDVAESEFELKILPGAGVGLSGGEDASTQTDLTFQVLLQKRLPYGTDVSFTPALQRTEDGYLNRARLRITQPLLRGAGKEVSYSGIYSAQYARRTAGRNLYLREVDIIIGAVQRAYNVIRQQELAKLQTESARRLADHAEAAAVKEQMGLVSAIDLYRARIQATQAREDLLRIEETYSEALDSLKFFLALPLEKEIAVNAPLSFDRGALDVDDMVETAMKNRAELVQARDGVGEAQRLSSLARKDTLPELNVMLSVLQTAEAKDDFPGSFPDKTEWGISFGSTTDLRRTAQKIFFQESLINIEAAVRRLEAVRDDITSQVKREVRSLLRLEQAIDNQEQQIQQARGQMELANVKFQHGLASNFDLIEAETALRRAQIQLISAVIDYIIGQYRLRSVLGTLVEPPAG
jgi:outer membrane protein